MADQPISTAVHDTLPESYVRPEAQRPSLDEVVPDVHIPVVNLADPNRAAVVSQIGEACRTHGFFQVLNHGIPVELTQAVTAVAYEFVGFPAEEKAKLYSDDLSKKMRLSTSFNVRKETVHNWRDCLRLHCHPLEQEIMSTYCKEVRELGFRLYGAISEILGLEEGYIKKALGEQEQHMAVNFYPKCPELDLTYGLPAYTDPNALTILLMDQQVAGLQVLNEGRCIEVNNPGPNSVVINIGDQPQVPVDEAMGAKAWGSIAVGAKATHVETESKHGRRGVNNLSAVLGIIAAWLAITGIFAVVTSPVMVFGFYVLLLAGLSLAIASVRAA